MASLNSNLKNMIINNNSDTGSSQLWDERAQTLLKQQDNTAELKKKISSYRAKMASTGAGGLSGSVEKGLTQDTQNANDQLALAFNQKLNTQKENLKKQQNTKRQKLFLNALSGS